MEAPCIGPACEGASDDELRALAQQILERDAYAEWRSRSYDGLDWIVEWIDGLLARLGAFSEAAPVLYMAMLFGLGIVALLLIAHIVWSVRVAMRASEAPPRLATATRTLPDFALQAESLASRGDFLAASHQVQLAVLQLLVERGFVELARHEPNRVLRRRVAEATALPATTRSDLRARIAELERHWFRDRTGNRELYDRWVALHGHVASLGHAR